MLELEFTSSPHRQNRSISVFSREKKGPFCRTIWSDSDQFGPAIAINSIKPRTIASVSSAIDKYGGR